MRKLLFLVCLLPALGGCCVSPSTLISLLPFFLRPDYKAEIEETRPEEMPRIFTPFCGRPALH
jgi:hypothetical protein